MSNADQVAIRLVEEATYGVDPGGTTVDQRFTSESLRQETQTVNSAEIRQDRQIVDVIRTFFNASGDLNWEMSYGAHDTLMEGALFSAGWSSPVTVTTSIAVATGPDRFTAASGLSGVAVVNQWIRASGFTNAANNGFFKVASGSGDTTIFVDGTGLVTEASGTRTLVLGGQIVNGTTLSSYTIERAYLDLATTFELFTGMVVDRFSMSLPADGIITGTFSFLGQDATSQTSGHSSNAAPTNGVMASVDNVPRLWEGDPRVIIDANTLSFQLNNNLRSRMQIGDKGPISIGAGSIDVTGTLQMYFETAAMFNKYLAFTTTSLAFSLLDSGGLLGYVIDFPRVKFTSGQRVAGGQNTDIIADLQWSAFRDPTELITMRIARWAA